MLLETDYLPHNDLHAAENSEYDPQGSGQLSDEHIDDDYMDHGFSKGQWMNASEERRVWEPSPNRFPPGTPFLEALSTCDSLECLHDAHELEKEPGVFNFPHFLIIGFQKTATTSLYR